MQAQRDDRAPEWSLVPEEKLQSAVRRLVDAFHPEAIILFGSYAYGTPGPESDLDLLVALDRDTPRRELRAEIRCSLGASRLPVQLLVRTPAEIQRALEIGDFFIREILARGRILYERRRLFDHRLREERLDLTFTPGGSMDEITNPLAWVNRAEGDYSTAVSVMHRRTPLTAIACFHVQQCVEKYLKALLVSRGQGFPKVHDLADLAAMLAQQGILVPIDEERLRWLTEYAVEPRYPGSEPTVEEAREALVLARATRRLARRTLGLK